MLGKFLGDEMCSVVDENFEGALAPCPWFCLMRGRGGVGVGAQTKKKTNTNIYIYIYIHWIIQILIYIYIYFFTFLYIYIYIHTIPCNKRRPRRPLEFLSDLHFFQFLTPRDPTIRNLQVEIYISTKRRQNPMEFRRFRDRFSIFQKRRVGPTLITRFSVYIYIYIYVYVCMYVYMYVNI